MTTITMKWFLVVFACIALGSRVTAATEASLNALELCHRAEFVTRDVAVRILDSGVEEAEAAVTQNPDDPVADFALFCNLAKRMAMRGFGLGLIRDLRHLRQALDRSLSLDPTYADAIAAKGALLFYMPRIAGGDTEEGERLIRSALTIDPANPVRLVLVDILIYRRAVQDAREEARTALAVLRSSHEPRVHASARAILGRLCGQSSGPREGREIRQQVCQAESNVARSE